MRLLLAFTPFIVCLSAPALLRMFHTRFHCSLFISKTKDVVFQVSPQLSHNVSSEATRFSYFIFLISLDCVTTKYCHCLMTSWKDFSKLPVIHKKPRGLGNFSMINRHNYGNKKSASISQSESSPAHDHCKDTGTWGETRAHNNLKHI